ncbi:acyltransferase [Pseudomonas guariconensis]|uniref:acyltransferase n=1 Tax=Pseudomonas guariconensis TaxID=1288410 RepID=UPI0018A9A1A6|nr:acyltransferase [Pseudomonas guariconensis]MBF8723035.1 acyltransferase [Pseudomonas guariconensis]MBF8742361.1 acyltransferase [Pseudomonas guariconensis]MBF8751528.1 acyltransferase [Pseudomonas guariconensis]
MKIIKNIVNYLAALIKGRDFKVDPAVDDAYLIKMLWSYAFSCMRGLFRLRAFVLLGKNVSLWSVSSLKFGKSVSIGDDCIINALSRNGVVFGNHVSIQKRTIIECTGSIRHIGQGLVLGNNVGIGSNSFLGCAGGIEISDDTIVGNYVSFHAENHNYQSADLPIRDQGVSHIGIKVGRGCWIGAKATILDGALIEDGCIIAAGALVTQGRYLANSIYGGVPAKFLRSRF